MIGRTIAVGRVFIISIYLTSGQEKSASISTILKRQLQRLDRIHSIHILPYYQTGCIYLQSAISFHVFHFR